MPRFDPSFLPEIPSVRETRTFVSTVPGGRDLTLTFDVDASGPLQMMIDEKAEALVARYGGSGREPLLSSSGRVMQLPFLQAQQIASFLLADRPDSDEDRWTERHWATLMYRDPKMWTQIVLWWVELLDKATNLAGHDAGTEESAKNASAALADISSAPAPTTDNPTPIS